MTVNSISQRMFDYPIDLDTPEACEIGFTSDKFEGYLWQDGKYIIISSIKSLQPRQGHLNALFANIQGKGWGIKVTNPLPVMEAICKKKGFTLTQGPVEPGICDDIVDIYVLKGSNPVDDKT